MSTPNLPEGLPPRTATPNQSETSKSRTRSGKKNESLLAINEGGSDPQKEDGNGQKGDQTSGDPGDVTGNTQGRQDVEVGKAGDNQVAEDNLDEDENRTGIVANITGLG
ncbi:uncharacterized protein MELLADRAFT_107127 [Melampsora larici-populina 98AG31]|uniref:Uncharacterized protein n=1 Tax=Melampsora larici-populina (strain 98AG31 / pathotype 3-4-7) TaxID=747676 RepID=F4RNS3_MELLP|nr:uncharacterized protein MELLADRAFT_107127 [Melampsora larici-populina 98AG31]EGG06043.1 hypothetical protein MELLADRAFT_107127 [Melampsora larici-populina 98AG31]